MIRIERAVVTGGRNFTDGRRIEADLRALLPLGLRRVAQGGNNVRRPRDLPRDAAWALLDGSAWALTADTPKPGHSADALAWHVARTPIGQRDSGIKESVTYFADWDAGDSAGPKRNTRMLVAEKPDLVLAYPDEKSRGTWHCIKQALLFGHPVALWCPWLTSEEISAAIRQARPQNPPRVIVADQRRHADPGKANDISSFLARTLRGDA